MKIKILNCNNIDEGLITIEPNKLNIKYGMNGTGKTTISKAIENYIKDEAEGTEKLKELTPFKGSPNKDPSIEGLEDIKKIMIFNEKYIEQFVFKEEELLKNSFEVFIKDENYLKNEIEINELLKEIDSTFNNDKEIEGFIIDLKVLNDSTKTKASPITKNFLRGDRLSNIPENLSRYTEYLRSEGSALWLAWHLKGISHLKTFSKCPYCTSELENNSEASRENIESLSVEFNSKQIENQLKTIELFKNLKSYFSDETNKQINNMLKEISGISLEQENFLKRITSQALVIVQKLENIKNLNFVTLKDFIVINKNLKELKINLEVIDHFKSNKSIEKFEKINYDIDNLIEKANILTGKVNIQKCNIRNNIKNHENEINDFLKIAGYLYKVTFELERDGSYKINLKSLSGTNLVKNVTNHLSYGEKNAFAMILFMYSALKENTDLIILDDPISSFDKNKKYSIIEKLFINRNSFSGKTVLLLTHDFEPILDMTYNRGFQSNVQPISHFLKNTNGKLEEKKIEKNDIKSCIQVAEENIATTSNNIIKSIYLRRLCEIQGNKKLAYNLISNLLHRRTDLIKRTDDGDITMTTDEKNRAIDEIKISISDFNYEKELSIVKSNEEMKKLYDKATNNYEKLQLYRIIKDEDSGDGGTVKKFLNETFHIENDFLFQLNPLHYEIIPQYIIEICDENLKSLIKN